MSMSNKEKIAQETMWRNWVNQFHISGLTTSSKHKSFKTGKMETYVKHAMMDSPTKGDKEHSLWASELMQIVPYAKYNGAGIDDHHHDQGVDHWTLWILGTEYTSLKSLDEVVEAAQAAIKTLTHAKAQKLWGPRRKLLKVDFERLVKWANSKVKITKPKTDRPGKIKAAPAQKTYKVGSVTLTQAAKLNAAFVKHTNKKGYVYNKFTLSDIYNDVRKGQYVLVTDHKSKFYRTKEVGKGFDRKSKDLPPIVGYSIARVFKIDQRHPEADAFLVVQDGRMRWCPEFVAILP
jgi:hypothetical protein